MSVCQKSCVFRPVALRPNYWLETSRERKPGLGYLQESRWKVKVRVPKGPLADLLLEQLSTPEQVQRIMVEHEFVEPDSAVDNRRKRALDAARKIVCVEKGGVAWKMVDEGKEESEEKEEEKQQQEKDENGWPIPQRSTSAFVYDAGQQINQQDGSLRSRMAKFLMRDNQSWGSGGAFDREGRDAHGRRRTHLRRKNVVSTLERRFDKGVSNLRLGDVQREHGVNVLVGVVVQQHGQHHVVVLQQFSSGERIRRVGAVLAVHFLLLLPAIVGPILLILVVLVVVVVVVLLLLVLLRLGRHRR